MAVAAPAAAQEQVIAEGPDVAGPVSHFGGVSAYSVREAGDRPATDRYFLTVVRDGQTTRMPIQPRDGVPCPRVLGAVPRLDHRPGLRHLPL